MSNGDGGAKEYLQAAGLVALTSGLCYLVRSRLQITDVAMLYLLAIVMVASLYRREAALLATLLSIAAFDFVFVPPYYTFDVHNAAYFLTFGVMLVVALIMSRLTERLRDRAEEAREREQRTAALYAMNQELAEGNRQRQVAVVTSHAARVVDGEAMVVLGDEAESGSDHLDWPIEGVFDTVAVRVAARFAYDRDQVAGLGTSQCAEAEALVAPLRTAARRLGVVAVRPDPPRMIGPAERRTIEALAEQAALALERTMLAEGHDRARLEVESERLRTALLSSLSHDLRTPLAGIEGAASSLLHDREALPPEVRRELAETILEESQRMSQLVANLLDMVRVETGGLAVRKTWQPLEEALGVAILRLEDRLRLHRIHTELPHNLPLVPIDELLIEQVFINLLENAAKHTPAGTTITVSAWQEDAAVMVEVADTGPGIRLGEEEAIFGKFYRSRASDHSAGAGLGLTICRGIVTAHGGQITVTPGRDGGAAFRFSLPLEGPPTTPMPPDLAEQSAEIE